jgi:hypothetical protein
VEIEAKFQVWSMLNASTNKGKEKEFTEFMINSSKRYAVLEAKFSNGHCVKINQRVSPA